MRDPHGQSASGTIRVAVPATAEFLSGLRVMARTAAALADLSVDDIEEIQMAVDEAATLLLPLAAEGDPEIGATFTLAPSQLRVSLSTPCAAGLEIDQAGLGWLMLTGLRPSVDVHCDDMIASITLTHLA